jgi:RHS repeat-associated protein
MSDTSGNQIGTTVKYLPFGGTRSGSVPTDKLFTGQRLDATGLYYYNARYYDATMGRFISPDTVIQSMANPQCFNRYSYCSNNPLKFTDPTGNWPHWVNNIIGAVKRCVQAAENTVVNIAVKIKQDIIQTYNKVEQFAAQKYQEIKETVIPTLFDIIGQINSLPNTLLGHAAGLLGGGTPSIGPRGTVIYSNIDERSITGKIMSAIQGNPVTLGYVTLNKDSTMPPDIQQHELGHVTQSAILGLWYLPLYGIDSLFHPNHDDKWMEGAFLPDWPPWPSRR